MCEGWRGEDGGAGSLGGCRMLPVGGEHGTEAQIRHAARVKPMLVHAVYIAADKAVTAWRFER